MQTTGEFNPVTSQEFQQLVSAIAKDACSADNRGFQLSQQYIYTLYKFLQKNHYPKLADLTVADLVGMVEVSLLGNKQVASEHQGVVTYDDFVGFEDKPPTTKLQEYVRQYEEKKRDLQSSLETDAKSILQALETKIFTNMTMVGYFKRLLLGFNDKLKECIEFSYNSMGEWPEEISQEHLTGELVSLFRAKISTECFEQFKHFVSKLNNTAQADNETSEKLTEEQQKELNELEKQERLEELEVISSFEVVFNKLYCPAMEKVKKSTEEGLVNLGRSLGLDKI